MNEETNSSPIATDPSSQRTITPQAGLDATIDRVAEQFISGEAIDSGTRIADEAGSGEKRKGGWPKGKARPKRIRVEGVGNGSGASLRDAPGSAPGNGGGALQSPQVAPVAAPPPLDLAAIEALVEGTIGLMDEFAQATVERAAGNKSKDANFAAECGKRALMSEKTRALLKVGGMGCVRKYAMSYTYIEETALGIGLGVWCLGLSSQLRAIKKLPEPTPIAAMPNGLAS